jgi:uncharacterized protein DUF3987
MKPKLILAPSRRDHVVSLSRRDAVEEEETPNQADNRNVQCTRVPADWPAPLAEEAFHGVAGELTRVIEPETESATAALLLQFLVAFGNLIGRTAYFTVERAKHFCNLFLILVGDSSKARKGTSWGNIKGAVSQVDEIWVKTRLASGLSSGEGIIFQVRDQVLEMAQSGKLRVADPGVKDKRLLVTEAEFASVLQVMKREGSTLSPLVRSAWDDGNLSMLTKNPQRATDAHISIIGHITKTELRRDLDTTSAANGFGNRFMWCCAYRSKFLPDGGKLTDEDLALCIRKIKRADVWANDPRELRRDHEASEFWHEIYPELSEGQPGLYGDVTARAEAITMRLALIYAVLDRSPEICIEHLRAALAVWKYCADSARFIFGDALGDPVADQILAALRQNRAGLTRTDISNLFRRNKTSVDIGRALALLKDLNKAFWVPEPSEGGVGRSAERWFARP